MGYVSRRWHLVTCVQRFQHWILASSVAQVGPALLSQLAGLLLPQQVGHSGVTWIPDTSTEQ